MTMSALSHDTSEALFATVILGPLQNTEFENTCIFAEHASDRLFERWFSKHHPSGTHLKMFAVFLLCVLRATFRSRSNQTMGCAHT